MVSHDFEVLEGLVHPSQQESAMERQGTVTAKEVTPLLGQSTMVEEIKIDVPGAPKPIKKASSMSRAASWMQKMRTDGCWPLRTIGFATGAALVVIAGLTFAAKLLNLNVIAAINQVWLMIFGLIMMLLETRTLNNFLSRRVNKWVTENLKILTYLSGRGVFYIFIGTLELGFYFSILHLVIGIILVSLGAAILVVGVALGAKLRSIRRELSSVDKTRQTFQQFDEDGDGRLSTTELSRLCHSLGSKLTHSELEAAIVSLDVNRDGYISEEEFLRWFRGDTELKVPSTVP